MLRYEIHSYKCKAVLDPGVIYCGPESTGLCQHLHRTSSWSLPPIYWAVESVKSTSMWNESTEVLYTKGKKSTIWDMKIRPTKIRCHHIWSLSANTIKCQRSAILEIDNLQHHCTTSYTMWPPMPCRCILFQTSWWFNLPQGWRFTFEMRTIQKSIYMYALLYPAYRGSKWSCCVIDIKCSGNVATGKTRHLFTNRCDILKKDFVKFQSLEIVC